VDGWMGNGYEDFTPKTYYLLPITYYLTSNPYPLSPNLTDERVCANLGLALRLSDNDLWLDVG
jgi:hypothetical protein